MALPALEGANQECAAAEAGQIWTSAITATSAIPSAVV